MNDESPLRGRLRTILIGPLVAVALGVLGLAPAFASPYPQGVVPDVDAWLDRALPRDAAEGTEIHVGATIWSTRDDGPIGSSAVFFRLYAGDGGPDFSEVPATEDWRGHFSATVTVPKGGVGELHIGTQGTSCDASGCTRSDAIYLVAGVGPPPTAPLPMIATAVIEPPRTVIVGVPFDVLVRLEPRADWDPDVFGDPETLRVVVREPRGADLAVAIASPAAESGTYSASITLPTEGSFSLQVAVDPADGSGGGLPVDAADLFTTSTVLVEALAAPAPSPSPTEPPIDPAASSADPMTPLLAALAVALIGVGALVALRRRPA